MRVYLSCGLVMVAAGVAVAPLFGAIIMLNMAAVLVLLSCST